MNHKPIPITAITGFLGAGKTTLLEYWLANNQGLRLGVVVNDYGDINLDAQFVASQSEETLELSSGCICCSLDSLELGDALDQFTHPGSAVDHIIIEASGLAEPADLAATLSQASGGKTKLDAIVAVLDPINAFVNSDSQKLTREQVEHSNFAIINKVDLASSDQIDRLEKLAININPRARILKSNQAQVDLRLLLDPSENIVRAITAQAKIQPTGKHQHNHHLHLHNDYSSVSFTTNQALDPARFQQLVNQDLPTNVFRAKGIVNLGVKGKQRKYRFQLVGNRAELSWSDWNGETPKTDLVLIGRDLDTAKLTTALEACIDHAPDLPNEGSPQIVLPKSRS